MASLFSGAELPSWLGQRANEQTRDANRTIAPAIGNIMDHLSIAFEKDPQAPADASWVDSRKGWDKAALEVQENRIDPLWRQNQQIKLGQWALATQGKVLQNDSLKQHIDATAKIQSDESADAQTFSKWQAEVGLDNKKMLESPMPEFKSAKYQMMGTKAIAGAHQSTVATDRVRLEQQKLESTSAVVKSFDGQVAGLAKTDPDLASPFLSAMGKPASPQLHQALGLAMETARQRKENAASKAAVDAQARGDMATTTITDKGVSTKYAAPKAVDATSNEPKQKVLADGETVTWMPGGKAFKMKSDGSKKEITPLQLQAYGKTLDDKDPDKKGILDAAKQGILQQIKARQSKPADAAPASKPSTDPLGLF